MAASVVAPRYSADDFETGSIRSAAPSYVSDAPSYHSTTSYHDPAPPPYAPPENRNSAGRSSNAAAGRRRNTHNRTASTPQQQTIGLPPVASAPPIGTPSLHNFRIPNWSTRNAPAARQLHSVIERRASAMSDVYRSGSGSSSSSSAAGASSPRRYQGFLDSPASSQDQVSRPLEDPYLVGDRAAEQARQERLSRESGDDILQREDQQWDWMLAQMRSWDEREKSGTRLRREAEPGQRKRVLRRIGARFP